MIHARGVFAVVLEEPGFEASASFANIINEVSLSKQDCPEVYARRSPQLSLEDRWRAW